MNRFEQLTISLFCAILLTFFAGCEEAPPAPTPAQTSSQAESVDGDYHSEEDHEDHEEHADDNGEHERTQAYERTQAEVGVGKKGRNYGGGVVTEPVRAMFRTEQRIHFNNMQRAMQMYKATNGNLPKSQDIFMKEIIEANSIQLPELPDGERYVYDADKGELMVERPKR